MSFRPSIDLSDVEEAVGTVTYQRGARYAEQGRVVKTQWKGNALHGNVIGSTDVYSASAYFEEYDDVLEFDQGECSCPIGFNCKHVVALLFTVASGRPVGVPGKRTWAESLDSLLESRPGGVGTVPLAVELVLTARAAGTPARVIARLVKPGRSGWVGSGLSWSALSSSYRVSDYRPDHVRLLQEIYGIYRSGDAQQRYSYSDDKSIDLSAFDSHRLWPMLDEAEAIGLQIVHTRKGLGPVARYGSAEFCLDVTRDEAAGELTVTPRVRVGGSLLDAVPIAFIGADGHGVVYADRAEVRDIPEPARWHLRLARLVKPVPAPLRRMAVGDEHIRVPAAGHDSFRDDYYPRLRRTATLISSDESFRPPAISEPTLVLQAVYGSEHKLGTKWQWAYQIGDRRLLVPLGTAGPDYRDPDAEQALIADLGLPVVDAEFHGLETMRFTTETMPLLAARSDVDIEVSGEPADYREASDSLSIGVSADELPGQTDWFGLGVTITANGREVPFTDVFVALAEGRPHVLLTDGTYFALDKPELRQLRTLIEEARALQDSTRGPLRISRFQAGLWDELTGLGVVHHQAKAWQEQVNGLLNSDPLEPPPVPATLAARLRPYQVDGFGWLSLLWRFRLGGILADDMGLGKTLQCLALICHARQEDPGIAPFLIVAPTSVVPNWTTEAGRFAPGLSVVALSDTTRKRGQTLAESTAGADVVVTSYTLFRLDFDAYAELSWSGLLLDEAQQVKNHQSKVHQCVRALPVGFKLAITGTPMENNLMELWSLLSITAPGLFPNPARFREYYAQPIEKGRDDELLGRLRRRIKPLVKRRTKEQVADDLPDKQEQVLEVDLHPRHRKIYQTHLQRERQKVLGLIDDVDRNRFTILRSLTLLRQLSLHPGLVDDAHQDLASSKIDALAEQLSDVIDSGHRALVFSQFTGFLGHVRTRLDADGVEYCYLDGKTRNRGAVLQRFKDGAVPVFLISLKAGGFGLNLTEADYCFLLDPWWNPATEAQAVDRTHRIGQTRNVMVYRLIARNTIEERVMALKTRKAELFSSVMDDGEMFGTALTSDDIRELFA